VKLNISYRHLESTESIKAKIEEKADHLKKYFKGHVNIDWVCSVDGDKHSSEVNVHAGKNHFHSHSEDNCLYKTLDIALNKIEKQIRKKNNMLKDKIHSHTPLS
jgi:putative sigma-54 modulation protein